MKEEIRNIKKAKSKEKDLMSAHQNIVARILFTKKIIQVGIVKKMKKEEKALIEKDTIHNMIKVRIIRIKNMIMNQKNMIIKNIIEREKDHHQAVNPEDEKKNIKMKERVNIKIIMKILKKLNNNYHKKSYKRKQSRKKN